LPRPIQVAISGAAGQISYSLVFRIAAGGLFGPEQPVGLRLLDVPEAMGVLEAVAMELFDCAFPLLAGVEYGTDPREIFRGADWIVLLGGRPRHDATQRRIDLIRENGPIYLEHGRTINEVAATARVLVVANPCNTNCLIAMSQAPNMARERWFAMNRLDRMRAVALVAEKARVAVAHVTRLNVWGNHSESIYPDLHNAWIGDRPAEEVIADRAWAREVLEPTVARRSMEIIGKRHGTPAATAAQAVLGSIRSISSPTPFNRRFGAGVVSDGSYGVPRGLVFGFPLASDDGEQWSIVQGLYLDDYAQRRINANIAELEHEAAVAEELFHIA
jgi:malate dehydrogenase